MELGSYLWVVKTSGVKEQSLIVDIEGIGSGAITKTWRENTIKSRMEVGGEQMRK